MHVGIASPRVAGKCSRHSRLMRNPHFYVSGKRPMPMVIYLCDVIGLHWFTLWSLSVKYSRSHKRSQFEAMITTNILAQNSLFLVFIWVGYPTIYPYPNASPKHGKQTHGWLFLYSTNTLRRNTSLGCNHYMDVIISAMTTQITGVSIVYLTVCSGADQRIHQSSASLAFARDNHR